MRDLSLEQLEGDVWGKAPADATTLVATIHDLRRKPVSTLTAENLRMLVGQRIGLPVLLPRVLTLLTHDPLVEGHFHAGDLLVAVVRDVPRDYWDAHPAERTRLRAILGGLDPADLDDHLRTALGSFPA